MPNALVSKQLKQREAVLEAKQRLKKGDKVVVAVEVTKVLDDGSVVISVPDTAIRKSGDGRALGPLLFLRLRHLRWL